MPRPPPDLPELRPYQRAILAALAADWRAGRKRSVLQMPTGAGKTFTAAHAIAKCVAKGWRVMVLVHRRELAIQWTEALERSGLPHRVGVIASGRAPQSHLPVQVASVATAIRRLDRTPRPDLIVCDEAHHAAATTYQRIHDWAPDARRIGLTATPARLDGKPLAGIYESIVLGPSVAELIEAGALSEYVCEVREDLVQTEGVAIRAGDYAVGEAGEAASTPKALAGVAHIWRDKCADRATMIYAATRAHGKALLASLREAGADAAYADGETPTLERDRIMGSFGRPGGPRALVSVALIGEGYDCPEATATIHARMTQSITVHLQQMGRVLRPSPDGRPALIVDCVGNIPRLGGPRTPITWTLAGKPEVGDDPDQLRKPPPEPGPAKPPPALETTYKTVRYDDGRELSVERRADGTYTRLSVERAVARAHTLEDMLALAGSLGYQPGWARMRWRLRMKRWEAAEDGQGDLLEATE